MTLIGGRTSWPSPESGKPKSFYRRGRRGSRRREKPGRTLPLIDTDDTDRRKDKLAIAGIGKTEELLPQRTQRIAEEGEIGKTEELYRRGRRGSRRREKSGRTLLLINADGADRRKARPAGSP
jgi:hypothetical protein